MLCYKINQIEEAIKNVNSLGKYSKIDSVVGTAVLMSEDEWNSIQETLNIKSIPGLSQSIKDGLKIPLEELSDELEW